MTPLSKEAKEARRPPKPESLVEAIQTPIHHEKIGKGRPARSVKVRRSK